MAFVLDFVVKMVFCVYFVSDILFSITFLLGFNMYFHLFACSFC